jgi:hypothetical protein
MTVGSTMYLAGDWASPNTCDVAIAQTTEGDWQTNCSDGGYLYNGYLYCAHYPYWINVELRKVTLKLSEVERLRRLAKGDKKAREILNKLGPCIEVQVDF